jgi:hypothetical protein
MLPLTAEEQEALLACATIMPEHRGGRSRPRLIGRPPPRALLPTYVRFVTRFARPPKGRRLSFRP